MRKVIIGIGILLLIVGGSLYFLIGNLDKIVKGSIEGIGSELFGVPVTIQSVKLDLKSGGGQITGLAIANPDGYSAKNVFQVDTIRFGLDLNSIGKQPLVINELTIVSPIIELETKKDGSSNLQNILDNIDSNSTKADKKAADTQPKSGNEATEEPMRMSFKTLSFTDISVNTTAPGHETKKVMVPDILMKDVGGAEGLSASGVGKVIVGDIVAKSLQTVLKKEVTKQAEKATEKFFEKLKDKLAH